MSRSVRHRKVVASQRQIGQAIRAHVALHMCITLVLKPHPVRNHLDCRDGFAVDGNVLACRPVPVGCGADLVFWVPEGSVMRSMPE